MAPLSMISYQEFYFNINYIIYKIVVAKKNNQVTIQYKNYLISFNIKEFSILTKINFESIDKIYDYIIDLFEENKVTIKNIIKKKEMKLNFMIDGKVIETILPYNEKNSDFIFNEINRLKNENEKLKKEINILKEYHNKRTNPKDIKFISDIVNDSYVDLDIDNTFTVFKSIKDLLYLVYSSKKMSIVFYDINNRKLIRELKNCHNNNITNLRHYLDEINSTDLIMSICSMDNNIKVWDINNWNILVELKNVYKNGLLYSACFLTDRNEKYIVTSNVVKKGDSGYLKVFNFNEKKVKEISKSNRNTLFVDSYFDDLLHKNYIVTGNSNYVKSYDFDENELYQKYHEKNNTKCHGSIVIKSNEETIKLIESCVDGYIRIWNFHTALLINKIKVGDSLLYGLCLWNNDYLFAGCEDQTIKLIDLNNGLTLKSLTGHKNAVLTIKKLVHPHFGEWLISQALNDGEIKLWTNSKNF